MMLVNAWGHGTLPLSSPLQTRVKDYSPLLCREEPLCLHFWSLCSAFLCLHFWSLWHCVVPFRVFVFGGYVVPFLSSFLVAV